jgi:membrane protein implicated in regulation of membrane protease activity
LSGLLESLNVTTLNCFYFGMLAGGLIFALGTLLLSGLGGDGDGGDADSGDVGGDGGDGDGAGGDLRLFSPVTLATFMAVFGAVGLICTVGLELDARLSLLIAGLSAVVISLAVAALYGRLLVALHGSTTIREVDMAGVPATVTTPIPADGLGEVLFEISNERLSRPARSADNTPVPRGATVVIEKAAGGNVVIVRQHQS